MAEYHIEYGACPYCGSDDIQYLTTDKEDGAMVEMCQCDKCDKEFSFAHTTQLDNVYLYAEDKVFYFPKEQILSPEFLIVQELAKGTNINTLILRAKELVARKVAGAML